MNILWLSWKCIDHPHSGGAEIVQHELCSRLIKDGHQVIVLTSNYNSSPSSLSTSPYKVVRVGNRWSVYFKAYRYFKRHLIDWPDLVIEEVNTIPFFTKFYVKQRRILFFHQLARQIWFYEMRFPLSLAGYLLEPLYLRIIRGDKVITVSKSTKNDLIKHGFKSKDIKIISEGIQMKPLESLTINRHSRGSGNPAKRNGYLVPGKYETPTLLSLGAIRPMKRTLDQITAFEIAKEKLSTNTYNLEPRTLKMIVAGDASTKYGKKVLRRLSDSKFKEDIEYLGKVSGKVKQKLLQKSHFILVTSIKEGWGLIVTEAASQGTPAIVYNVDGLRDSVINNWSGNITQNNRPDKMADKIVDLLNNKLRYNKFRKNAWTKSKQINFDVSYSQFKELIHG